MNKANYNDLSTICFAKFESNVQNLLFEFLKFAFFCLCFRYILKQFVIAYSKFLKNYRIRLNVLLFVLQRDAIF